jgi:hypothetical protein
MISAPADPHVSRESLHLSESSNEPVRRLAGKRLLDSGPASRQARLKPSRLLSQQLCSDGRTSELRVHALCGSMGTPDPGEGRIVENPVGNEPLFLWRGCGVHDLLADRFAAAASDAALYSRAPSFRGLGAS